MAEGGIEEMARRGYAAWNEADVDGALATMHEDVVYETSGVFPGMRERYEGREEVREFFGDFGGPWEKVDVIPVRVETLDEDHLLVEVRFHARGRTTGGSGAAAI